MDGQEHPERHAAPAPGSAGLRDLASWRGQRLGPVTVLGEIDSTNGETLRRIGRGTARVGEILIAERQTGGHGSRGRPWLHVAGKSLALTTVVALPPATAFIAATLLGAVAVTDALRALGLPAAIKWPNDALLRERKVAGVLAETVTQGPARPLIALGIGWNVGHELADFQAAGFPAGLATPPTSLHLEGSAVSVAAAARELLQALDRRVVELEATGDERLRRTFVERLNLVGRRVRAERADGPVDGRLVALDADGNVELDDASSSESGSPAGPGTGLRRLPGGHLTALRALEAG